MDLGAPGSNIASTVMFDGYASYSRTSMATPHISGALALMYAVKPDLSAADAKRIVMFSGETLPLRNTVSGKRLDVAAAISALLTLDDELAQPTQFLNSITFDLFKSYLSFTPNSLGSFTSICTKTEYTNFPVNPEPVFETISFSKDDDSVMISLGFTFPFM